MEENLDIPEAQRGDMNIQRMKVAAERGDISMFKNLIKEDPFILRRIDRVPFIDTPLHTAAEHGQTEFAMEIMSWRSSFFNKLNPEGLSAIHVALKHEQKNLALQLLHANRDHIPCVEREKIVPIHYVVEEGNIDLLRSFLSASPQSIQDLTTKSETILHIALKNDKMDACWYLVRHLRTVRYVGASKQETKILNWKDNEGNTILHIAVSKNQPQVVELLINCGVDINIKNSDDSTALDILDSGVNNQEVRRMLVAAGATSKASSSTHVNVAINSEDDHLMAILSFKERLITSIIRFKRDIENDKHNALLVVVVLIATVTYQASLTPPGGVWQDNSYSSATHVHHNAGKVIMSNVSFLLFWFFNSITLWTTELAFFFLIDGRFSKLLFLLLYLFSQSYTIPLALVSPSPVISIVLITISAALPLIVFMWGYWFFHRVAKNLKEMY